MKHTLRCTDNVGGWKGVRGGVGRLRSKHGVYNNGGGIRLANWRKPASFHLVHQAPPPPPPIPPPPPPPLPMPVSTVVENPYVQDSPIRRRGPSSSHIDTPKVDLDTAYVVPDPRSRPAPAPSNVSTTTTRMKRGQIAFKNPPPTKTLQPKKRARLLETKVEQESNSDTGVDDDPYL